MNLETNNTILCATRYGNVMGTRGSVIPLFINQIKSKKNITITDSEMTRFIMSLDDSVKLAKFLSDSGVDCIDCSSGGILGRPRFAATDDGKKLESNLDRGLGFQVPYADEIKNKANILTMAVGVIVNPSQAENIIQNNQADLVAMGREMMYNPFWSLHAAQELNADTDFQMWPEQYKWGVERRSKITKFKDII